MNNPSAPPLPPLSAPQNALPNPITSAQNLYPGPTVANQNTAVPVSSQSLSSNPSVSQSELLHAHSLPQPSHPVNNSTQHSQQMSQTAGVPGAQALAPIQVPGHGTMYPILGRNGQVTYSFQPQQASLGNPNSNTAGIQDVVANAETQTGGMSMSTDAKPIGTQGIFQNAGMHPNMIGMPIPGGVSGMDIKQHTGANHYQGLNGNANSMAMQSGLGVQGNLGGTGVSADVSGIGASTGMNGMGMQGGMNGMGAQGGMNGMGMQGGMNGMGTQGGMNGIGMQGGMNGMGTQGGMNGMGMQGGMNGMGMQGGMNGMGTQGGMNGMDMQGGMHGGMHGIGASYGMHGMGMQGGTNEMGTSSGIQGMGMQGGMNRIGMHGGTNSTTGQGGAYGMGSHLGMSNMGMQNVMNPMGMQGGMTNMATASQTPTGGHPGSAQTVGSLQLKAVGGFKDMNSQVHDLPQVTITNIDEAGNRVFALKSKVNELQAKHDSYKNRQIANGGVAAASALFTFGTSLLVQGPAAVHQHNRMQTIKRAMPPCLEQINLLRDQYGAHPSWPQREATVMITEKVFTNGVNRNDLKGSL